MTIDGERPDSGPDGPEADGPEANDPEAKGLMLWDLTVTVERIEGRPVCGLVVGDSFSVTQSSQLHLPPGGHFCIYALASILPLLPARQRPLADGDWMERDSLVACPDPDERLIMRIARTRRRRLAVDDLT